MTYIVAYCHWYEQIIYCAAVNCLSGTGHFIHYYNRQSVSSRNGSMSDFQRRYDIGILCSQNIRILFSKYQASFETESTTIRQNAVSCSSDITMPVFENTIYRGHRYNYADPSLSNQQMNRRLCVTLIWRLAPLVTGGFLGR